MWFYFCCFNESINFSTAIKAENKRKAKKQLKRIYGKIKVTDKPYSEYKG